jgi:hypothetical protein
MHPDNDARFWPVSLQELHMVEGAAHVSRQASLRRSGELALTIDDIGGPGEKPWSAQQRRSSTGSSIEEEPPRPEIPPGGGRRRSVAEGLILPRLSSRNPSAKASLSFTNSGQFAAAIGAPHRGGSPRARSSVTAAQVADVSGFESRRGSRFGGEAEVLPILGEAETRGNGPSVGPSVRDGALMKTRFAEALAAEVPTPEVELPAMELTRKMTSESVQLALRQMQAEARGRPSPLERTWDTFTQAHTPQRLNNLIREKSEVSGASHTFLVVIVCSGSLERQLCVRPSIVCMSGHQTS